MEKKKTHTLSDKITQVQKEAEWDKYYMKIACLAALRSKDPTTPVGACIVDEKDHQIVGIGYNSMPYVKDNDNEFPWDSMNPPVKESKANTLTKQRRKDTEEKKKLYDKRHTNQHFKYPYVVHAAANAIAQRTRNKLDGCTIYLTLHPDDDCAHAIIMAGITKVICCMFTRNDEKLDSKMEIAAVLLEAKRIPIVPFDLFMNDKYVKELSNRINEAKTQLRLGIAPKGPYKNAISWDTFFMKIAMLSKKRPGEYDSRPDMAVGACIVSKDKQVMAIGFSGYPEGTNPEEIKEKVKVRYNREIKNEELHNCIRHAEYKAILGGPSVKGCTLYVTKYPCHECAKIIIQSGITKVVYYEEGKKETYKLSKRTLETCLGSQNIRLVTKNYT